MVFLLPSAPQDSEHYRNMPWEEPPNAQLNKLLIPSPSKTSSVMTSRWQLWNLQWFLYLHISCTSPYTTSFCQFSGSFCHKKSVDKHPPFGGIPFIKPARWCHPGPSANWEQGHSTASLSVLRLQRSGDVLQATSPHSPRSPPDLFIAT